MSKIKNSDNPTYRLFGFQALVSLGGLFAFLIADRLLFGPVIQGQDTYIQRWAVLFLPIMISSAGAFLIFKVSFMALEHQLREREAERQRHMKELERSYQGLMMSLVAALETRDHQAQGHSRRVVVYSRAIAERLGLSSEEKRNLVFGAYLHDVGKLGVDDTLLQKPAGLSEGEWELMRRHPTIGVQILQGVEFLLKGAIDVILCHHERYDGKGYPLGLVGEDIPILARIFTVADSFDAMTADRPYRGKLMFEEAREVIRKEAGKQFCPRCVEAFLSFSCDELAALRRMAEEEHLAYLGEADGAILKDFFIHAGRR